MVQVLDTGVGIERNNLDLILDAFTQENSSISRKFGGTGLGLSIVNRLLTVMGSQLQIESTVGEGSMFGFELTLDKAERPNLSVVSDDAGEEVTLEGFRMLYVEDMDPNRFVMKAMVKPWNVDLDMAESGLKALELVRENTYDLILMDIQMPEMDGVETLAQMHLQQGSSWTTLWWPHGPRPRQRREHVQVRRLQGCPDQARRSKCAPSLPPPIRVNKSVAKFEGLTMNRFCVMDFSHSIKPTLLALAVIGTLLVVAFQAAA